MTLNIHNWHSFVLGFSPDFVFGNLGDEKLVLDPFNGFGTTSTVCIEKGIKAIGFDVNPVALAVANAKAIALSGVLTHLQGEIDWIKTCYAPDTQPLPAIAIRNSISIEHWRICRGLAKAITIYARPEYRDFLMTALFHTAVVSASNLVFKPEVSVSRSKYVAPSESIVQLWGSHAKAMLDSVVETCETGQHLHRVDACDPVMVKVHLTGDEGNIDRVITSPPYPNEKDYTRATRLELTLLGYALEGDLRRLRKMFMRSNSKAQWKGDLFGKPIEHLDVITDLAKRIEAQRIELNKTDGFTKKYPKVITAYFGQMHTHLSAIKPYLKSGARLSYLVGDQSYLEIPIPTGELVAVIAKDIGYKDIELIAYRQRNAGTQGKQIEWIVNFTNP